MCSYAAFRKKKQKKSRWLHFISGSFTRQIQGNFDLAKLHWKRKLVESKAANGQSHLSFWTFYRQCVNIYFACQPGQLPGWFYSYAFNNNGMVNSGIYFLKLIFLLYHIIILNTFNSFPSLAKLHPSHWTWFMPRVVNVHLVEEVILKIYSNYIFSHQL